MKCCVPHVDSILDIRSDFRYDHPQSSGQCNFCFDDLMNRKQTHNESKQTMNQKSPIKSSNSPPATTKGKHLRIGGSAGVKLFSYTRLPGETGPSCVFRLDASTQ